MQGLTQKVYEFKNQNIKEHIGDINDFLNAKKVLDFKQFELDNKQKSKSKISIESPNKLSYNQKKQLDKDIKKQSNKIKNLERSIENIEKELKELDLQLSDPQKYKELSAKPNFFEDYKKKQDKLNKTMEEWDHHTVLLDELNLKKEHKNES